MIPHTFSDEGIVLARRNFGEADRILVVYSKNHGKISLLAKGVRKPASRKRGHIEIFSLIKFSAANGKSLDIMTEAEIIDSYSEIRKDLNKVALAYYFVEVIAKITHDGEPNRHLFELIREYLFKLKSENGLKNFRKSFVYEVLVLLGFWPQGKPLLDPDLQLEEVIERQLTSVRVGKKLLL